MEYVLLLVFTSWPTPRPTIVTAEYKTESACRTAAMNFANTIPKDKGSVIWTCDLKGSTN